MMKLIPKNGERNSSRMSTRLIGFNPKYSHEAILIDEIINNRWPLYWPTGRLADNQKIRNLTDNLSKMSNKTYSRAVIGQFKTLFRKRKNIPLFFQLV